MVTTQVNDKSLEGQPDLLTFLKEQGCSLKWREHLPNRHSMESSVDGSYFSYYIIEFPEGTFYRFGGYPYEKEYEFFTLGGRVLLNNMGRLSFYKGEIPSWAQAS